MSAAPAGPQPAPDRQPTTTAPEHAGAPPAGPRTGRVVLGVLLILVGAGWLIDALGLAQVRWSMVLPTVLIVIGLALLATARRPAAGGLVTAGVIVSILVLVSSLMTFPFTGRLTGVGDVRHQPTSAEAVEDGFALGIGSLEVDLRQLPPPDDVVEAGVGIGELVVVVPEGATVDVHARAGMGEVVVAGRSHGGIGVDVNERIDGDEGAGKLVLEVSVGMGKVEVRR